MNLDSINDSFLPVRTKEKERPEDPERQVHKEPERGEVNVELRIVGPQ